MVRKRIVCLANSRKQGGRCVAGIELAGRSRVGWIRPVSTLDRDELMDWERRLPGGDDAYVLDVLDVPLLKPEPKAPQTENWLLDPKAAWRKVGRFGWDDLDGLLDSSGPLWINGYSTRAGRNDQIPVDLASGLWDSLRLIKVAGLDLRVWAPGEDFGNPKRRVQARFRYAGAEYWLWVTDPEYETAYLARPNGQYRVRDSFLTISIGEPYAAYCYKLVAAIIEREREVAS